MEEGTFPSEVWLEILKNIDIESLMKLRLVCHQFYDLIEYILNKSPEWKKLTHRTVLSPCLEMTMQRAYPDVLVTHWKDIDDPVLWRGIYLSYKKWQKVLVNPHTKDAIVPQSNLGHISCVSTFDKYIAIAFDSGLIANYTIDNINQPFYLADHGTSLIQVGFWYSNSEVLVVSVGEDCTLKFWDIQNKIEIATDGFFANSISFGECRHFCIGDTGGILTSYERVGKHISPGPTLDLELGDNEQLIAHVVDGKYMAAMIWENGATTILLSYKGVIEGGKLIEFMMMQENDSIGLPENLATTFQRLLMETNALFAGSALNRIKLRSSLNYKNVWTQLGRYLRCKVISLAVHAQIMILGLEDGSIQLLRIPENYYSIGLEECIKYLKKIVVDTEPIVDLTVLEVDKKPCIVAVTKQKVHLINFF